MPSFSQVVLDQLTERRHRQLRVLVHQLKAQGLALDERAIFPPRQSTIREEFESLIRELRANGIDLNKEGILAG